MGKNIILLAVMLILAGCARENPQTTQITEQACADAGGNWNECSSPCLGEGKEVCIQVCVAQCECAGIAGFNCPDGYECRTSGKIADELGRCIRE